MKTKKVAVGLLVLAMTLQNPVEVISGEGGKKGNTSASVKAVKNTNLPVDITKSVLTWNAKKVGGEHSGTVKLANGSLALKGNKLVGGIFEMDMKSISDTDISNEGMNAKLTNHLKSEDFFSVDKYPVSTFKITKSAPIAGAKSGENNYTITGDLTIKGITHPVTFPATVNIANDQVQALGKVSIDRTKYDIKYRSSLVGTVADKIIDDIFTIDLKLVTAKPNPNS